MKKYLFEKVFEKAEKQSGNTTKHGLSTHLERVFDDELSFNVSRVTFVRYYEKYIEENGQTGNNPGSDLLNKASEYLGYANYEDFVTKNEKKKEHDDDPVAIVLDDKSKEENGNTFFIFFKKNKVVFFLGGMILTGLIIFFSLTQQRWMVWEKDHYVEVKFDAQLLSEGTLKVYKKERIEDFKKVPGDCNTPFFTPSGEVNIWYGKNLKGELECFTSPGLHPETGKTLRPITKYMIDKYLCKDK